MHKLLQAGQIAPDFTLLDQSGSPVTLSDYSGHKRIVYFYPRDNTPGCTRQACAFAAAHHIYAEKGIIVIGISKDNVSSHTRFAQKYELPFLLLSDPERIAIQAYGVWQEKKNYGKISMGVVRTSYYIDEQGIIQKVWPKVKPDTNAEEILSYLDSLPEAE